MLRVDIDGLTEEELVELNHKIVHRLRLLRQARAHYTMMEYRIGQRVEFLPPNRPPLTGVLTRFNKKTVTVITDNGEHWNIAPALIKPTDENDGERSLHLVR